VYILATVARRRITRYEGDIREHPRYSIEEAADYLRIPHSTMKAWTRGQRYTTRSGREIVFKPVIEPRHALGPADVSDHRGPVST